MYNDINMIVGNLETWNEMKKSIASAGLVLYGKYAPKFGKGSLRQCYIFSWEPAKKNRGALLNKLYGYKIGRKRYKGFLDRHGMKIGKSAALIPLASKDDLMKILEKYSAGYRIVEVFAE